MSAPAQPQPLVQETQSSFQNTSALALGPSSGRWLGLLSLRGETGWGADSWSRLGVL